MSKKLNLSKNTKMIIALVLVAIISIGFSFAASKPEMYKPVYEVLDEKRADALALSAGALTTSAVIAALPTDLSTPAANQVAEISSYTLLIVCIIFLEKLLLTSMGLITFALLIPVACVFGIIYLLNKKDFFRVFAIKLSAFGLVLFLIVPSSVLLSTLIEKSTLYKEAEIKIEAVIDEENEDRWIRNGKDLLSGAKEHIKKRTNEFIDAVSIMLITTCAIPLGTLALMLWIVKMLFGINVKMPNPPKIKIPTKQKEISEKTDIPQISNQ